MSELAISQPMNWSFNMQTVHIKVTGMTCGGCVNSLTRALKAVAGVGEVTVLLSTGDTSVQFDEHLSSLEQIKLAVENAGYGVA
jgi:copper chaperone CopZ